MENAYQVVQVYLQQLIAIKIQLLHILGIQIPKNAVHVSQ